MYYSYIEIEYVAMSFSLAKTDLALKLLTLNDPACFNVPLLQPLLIIDLGVSVCISLL
jgi:hypothetical protein